MDNMMKNIILILFLIFNFFITAFAGDIQIPKGKIIYAIGNDSIYTLDLKTLYEKVIYKEKAFLSGLSKLNSSTFLFTSNDVRSSQINEFDLSTKKSRQIMRGFFPIYMPASKKILFYNASSKNDGDWIYEVSYNDEQDLVKKIIRCDSGICGRPIRIANNKVVLNDMHNKGKVFVYDLLAKRMKLLPISNCDMAQIWRNKTKQLLCADAKNKNYFLVGLNGRNKQVINLGEYNNVSPILYIPETDQLIYSRLDGFLYWEHYDWWLYDFKTERKRLLLKNTMGQVGDAIYLPNEK